MSIFPIEPSTLEFNESSISNKEFKEYAIDFKTGEMIYKDGKSLIVEGKEALKIWIFKAIQTTKNRYEIYDEFGNEFESIVGKGYSKGLIKTLLQSLIKECLFQNEFIKDVLDLDIEIEGAKININANVITSFGEVKINV